MDTRTVVLRKRCIFPVQQIDEEPKAKKKCIRKVRARGEIVSLERNRGLISNYDMQKVYFEIKSYIHSKYFKLSLRDKVSYYQKCNFGSDLLYAINIDLLWCCRRSTQEIDQFVEYVVNLIKKVKTTDHAHTALSEVTTIMNCVPIWICIGDSDDISEEAISGLIEAILECSQIECIKNMFTALMGEFMKTDLFNVGPTGRFIEYVVYSIENGLKIRVNLARKFIGVLLKLLPHNSEQLFVLLTPIISSDTQSNENFLYRLLFQTAKLNSATRSDINEIEWNHLPLVPSTEELFLDMDTFNSLPTVHKHVAYESVSCYFDTYFRLLRANSLFSLTIGVEQLLRGTLEDRDMNVFRNLELVGIDISHRGLLFAFKLFELGKKITNKNDKSLLKSAKLMQGSLVCISLSGTFKDPIWALVANRDLLDKHIIVVELCPDSNKLSEWDIVKSVRFANESSILVESPTYYRAHQPVLKALQQLSPDELAFTDEIVKSESHNIIPEYITHETTFKRSMFLMGNEINLLEYCRSNNDVEQDCYAPQLDPSQLLSLKDCFLNRLAIIQGPPGTGKTFIGVKLVKMILSLTPKAPKPILVVTYKNHCLDEFLKSLIPSIKIVRVGGRSKEVDLNSYNLHTLMKNSFDSHCNEIRQILQKYHGQKRKLNEELDEIISDIDNEIGSTFKPMKFTIEVLLKYYDEEQLYQFLINCPNHAVKGFVKRNQEMSAEKRRELLELALKDWLPSETSFTRFRSEYCLKEIQTKTKPNKILDSSNQEDDEKDEDEMMKELRGITVPVSKKETEDVQDAITKFSTSMTEMGTLMNIAKDLSSKCSLNLWLDMRNIWVFSTRERVQMVQCILYNEFKTRPSTIQSRINDYKEKCQQIAEIDDLMKAEILRQRDVIGMTVTGANINRRLLANVKPAIVIVEEAAEILEPQLIAVIGSWAKHLIMIGDHKQLKPSVECHKLSVNNHFDISMMERLINNRLPHSMLDLQNRMQQEFAELLVDIYPELKTNMTTVGHFKPLNCCKQSMFFWDQKGEETRDRSYANKNEAECAIRLALFLLSQDNELEPKNITILTPYLGQMKLIRQELLTESGYSRLLRTDKENENKTDLSIFVRTIDSYQGDENEIVIISLVRSNDSGDIGFLKQLGRRCVAQSRARRGMYFIGNRETLSKNEHWNSMITKMSERGCVGESFPYCCPEHRSSGVTFSAETANDLPDHNTQFCKIPCNYVYHGCEHPCTSTCQPKHIHGRCNRMIIFKCNECNAQLVRECFEPELIIKCKARVNVKLRCGHACTKECCKNEEEILCKHPCSKTLECGHPCELKCGEKCNPNACKMCEQIRMEEARKQQEAERKKIVDAKRALRERLKEIKASESICHVLPLKDDGETAPEYANVTELVKRHAKFDVNIDVLEIWKITNLRLEEQWLQKQVKLCNPLVTPLQLFYSTDFATTVKIAMEGFNYLRNRSQHHSQTYIPIHCATTILKQTSKKFSKSDHKADSVLICDVAIGKAFAVNKLIKVTDKVDDFSNKTHDSVFVREMKVGDQTLRNQYLVYDTRQVIPRYRVQIRQQSIVHSKEFQKYEREALRTETDGVIHHHINAPSRTVSMKNDDLELHFRLAESQFLRMMPSSCHYKVDSVDYYLNPPLVRKFYEMQSKLESERGADTEESKYVLAFHGTKEENITGIVNNNFDITKLADSTGCEGKYGAGIYFSEFPDFSMRYGKCQKLLLCKILPGKPYDCKTLKVGSSLEHGFDSHRFMRSSESQGRGEELVIFDADQILPCYVINYYKQA